MTKPTRTFNASQGQWSRGTAGPDQLETDMDLIIKALNPDISGGGLLPENLNSSFAVSDAVLGNRTVDQAIVAASANTGTLTQILSWIAKAIKGILGSSATNWYDTPSTDLTLAAAHIAAAAPHSGHETPAGAQAKVDTHTGTTTGAHAGTAVSFSPTTEVTSVNVQAAIAELGMDISMIGSADKIYIGLSTDSPSTTLYKLRYSTDTGKAAVWTGAAWRSFVDLSLPTTTGDLLYASSANVLNRLSIGATDQVLTVAGGVPTWADASGGAAVLVQLAHSAMVQCTAYSDYNTLLDGYFYADTARHSSTLKVGVMQYVDTGVTGQAKITVTDGTNSVNYEYPTTTNTNPNVVTCELNCATLTTGKLWYYTLEGKVTAGTGYYNASRFYIKADPMTDFTTEMLMSVVPGLSFNVTSFPTTADVTRAFACSHVMDTETSIKAVVRVTFGTGVTAAQVRIRVSAYDTSEQVTIDCASTGIVYTGTIAMPITAQPYQVDVWCRVSGGSGTATLDYYELQMEL